MSVPISHNRETLVRERNKSWMLRAWILSGIFFMALPGTLLGFSNLMAISAHHGLGSMSPAWMEGHGHAQMYGWIGSFILGIGFYSQPVRKSGLRVPMICFGLWTAGVLLRWVGNIYEWHWRSLLLGSSAAELVAVLLFLSAASHHKIPETEKGTKKPVEIWMIAVLLSTAGLTAAVIFNLVECLRLALYGATPSFPHLLDQKYLVLLGWGFLAPVVWGFSARWLPAFLAINEPRPRALKLALAADILGRSGRRVGSVVGCNIALLCLSNICGTCAALDGSPAWASQGVGSSPELSVFHPDRIYVAGNCRKYECLGSSCG